MKHLEKCLLFQKRAAIIQSYMIRLLSKAFFPPSRLHFNVLPISRISSPAVLPQMMQEPICVLAFLHEGLSIPSFVGVSICPFITPFQKKRKKKEKKHLESSIFKTGMIRKHSSIFKHFKVHSETPQLLYRICLPVHLTLHISHSFTFSANFYTRSDATGTRHCPAGAVGVVISPSKCPCAFCFLCITIRQSCRFSSTIVFSKICREKYFAILF